MQNYSGGYDGGNNGGRGGDNILEVNRNTKKHRNFNQAREYCEEKI